MCSAAPHAETASVFESQQVVVQGVLCARMGLLPRGEGQRAVARPGLSGMAWGWMSMDEVPVERDAAKDGLGRVSHTTCGEAVSAGS